MRVAPAALDVLDAVRRYVERRPTRVATAMATAMAQQADDTNRLATTDVHVSKRAA